MTQLFGQRARSFRLGSRAGRLAFLTAVLGASALATATDYHGHDHDHHDRSIGPFGGPLFGLDGTEHGKLLVADASVGIIPSRYGAPIPLPGVSDISATRGAIWAVTGASPAAGGPQVDSGQGVHIIDRDGPRKIANLFEFETNYNPHKESDTPVPDSNPFDVHALGRYSALVVDAGGNDLLRVNKLGEIDVLAVFPTTPVSTENIKRLAGCPDSGAPFCGLPDLMPAQAVPTSVAVDRNGYIYVGELRGFPAPTNESSIWRISPSASGALCGQSPDCVKVFDGGFTSIIDLAFGPDGLLYVAELDEGSWAAIEIFGAPQGGTINACSIKYRRCQKVARGIDELTAITFDDDDDLWATRHALIPGEAEVIKIDVRRHGHRHRRYDDDHHKDYDRH